MEAKGIWFSPLLEQAGASSALISRTRTEKQPYYKNYFKLHSISQAGRVSLIHNAKKNVSSSEKQQKMEQQSRFAFFFFTKVQKVKGSAYG